jgi:hypothetical protein
VHPACASTNESPNDSRVPDNNKSDINLAKSNLLLPFERLTQHHRVGDWTMEDLCKAAKESDKMKERKDPQGKLKSWILEDISGSCTRRHQQEDLD